MEREDHAPQLDGLSPAGKAGSFMNYRKPLQRKAGREDMADMRRKGDKLPDACKPHSDVEAVVEEVAAIGGFGGRRRT